MKPYNKYKVARGRTVRRQAGEMNKTELRYYNEVLLFEERAGKYLKVWFESYTFKLASNCRYTPDFVVQLPNGELEIHEDKGHWEDDALVKIKVAAEQFPFRFMAVSLNSKRDGGGWLVREF